MADAPPTAKPPTKIFIPYVRGSIGKSAVVAAIVTQMAGKAI